MVKQRQNAASGNIKKKKKKIVIITCLTFTNKIMLISYSKYDHNTIKHITHFGEKRSN